MFKNYLCSTVEKHGDFLNVGYLASISGPTCLWSFALFGFVLVVYTEITGLSLAEVFWTCFGLTALCVGLGVLLWLSICEVYAIEHMTKVPSDSHRLMRVANGRVVEVKDKVIWGRDVYLLKARNRRGFPEDDSVDQQIIMWPKVTQTLLDKTRNLKFELCVEAEVDLLVCGITSRLWDIFNPNEVYDLIADSDLLDKLGQEIDIQLLLKKRFEDAARRNEEVLKVFGNYYQLGNQEFVVAMQHALAVVNVDWGISNVKGWVTKVANFSESEKGYSFKE